MCGPKYCSMKITEDIRKMAADQPGANGRVVGRVHDSRGVVSSRQGSSARGGRPGDDGASRAERGLSHAAAHPLVQRAGALPAGFPSLQRGDSDGDEPGFGLCPGSAGDGAVGAGDGGADDPVRGDAGGNRRGLAFRPALERSRRCWVASRCGAACWWRRTSSTSGGNSGCWAPCWPW
jgi:hypothetical protein